MLNRYKVTFFFKSEAMAYQKGKSKPKKQTILSFLCLSQLLFETQETPIIGENAVV